MDNLNHDINNKLNITKCDNINCNANAEYEIKGREFCSEECGNIYYNINNSIRKSISNSSLSSNPNYNNTQNLSSNQSSSLNVNVNVNVNVKPSIDNKSSKSSKNICCFQFNKYNNLDKECDELNKQYEKELNKLKKTIP